jgi:hypothetical protein
MGRSTKRDGTLRSRIAFEGSQDEFETPGNAAQKEVKAAASVGGPFRGSADGDRSLFALYGEHLPYRCGSASVLVRKVLHGRGRGRFVRSGSLGAPAVCTDNLNAGVAVMKSAQDGA